MVLAPKLLKSAVCVCGHDKPTHGTGLKLYGSHDYACIMMGCECQRFELLVEERPKRVIRAKTLDRDEPHLFDV